MPAHINVTHHTIQGSKSITGVGVHSGQEITLKISPRYTPGIVFIRTDIQNSQPIAARWTSVSSTQLSTTLSNAMGHSVSTVEHLMAALWSLKIDSAIIHLDGPEVPILDGSALPWVQLLEDTSLCALQGKIPCIEVDTSFSVEEGPSKKLTLSPAPTFTVDITASIAGEEERATYTWGHPLNQDILCARTFSFFHHVEAMKKQGFIKGGSLENALVLNENGQALNETGRRVQNECAAHKLLDFIGDWALSGTFFLGKIEGYAPGHTLNHTLLSKVMTHYQNRFKTFFVQSAPLQAAV